MPDTTAPARMFARTSSSRRSIALPLITALVDSGSYTLEPTDADPAEAPGRRGRGPGLRTLVRFVMSGGDRTVMRSRRRMRHRDDQASG